MAIELIAKIKPKNNGSFAMVDAQDVEFEDGRRLDAVINSIGYTDADFMPVFENLTPTFTEGEDAYGEPSGKYATILDDVTLVVDAVYKVVWDGKERICKCFGETEGSGLVINMPMIGNADIAFPGAYGNGEEFFFMTYTSVEDESQKTSIITTDKGETHTISLFIFEKASELPKVTEEDNDKVLKVVGGRWQAATGGGGGGFVADTEPPEDTSLLWIDTDDDTETEVYTKAEVDTMLTEAMTTLREALEGYYTKAEIDTMLTEAMATLREDLEGYYTKAEVDTMLTEAMATLGEVLEGYYTKTEVDAALGAYITDIDALVGGDS